MATRDEIFGPREVRHERCGGIYIARAASEVVEEDGTCPVCRDILARHRLSGGLINLASYGTALALELGLVVTTGQTGPVTR